MAKFQALIQQVDDPGEKTPKRGDIVKVAPLNAAFGKREGLPRYAPVELEFDDYYHVENLEMPIDDDEMAAFPSAIRSSLLRLIQYTRARDPVVRAAHRYRVNDSNIVEDKANGNTIVSRA